MAACYANGRFSETLPAVIWRLRAMAMPAPVRARHAHGRPEEAHNALMLKVDMLPTALILATINSG